jgi:hypothetical protein
VRWLQRHAPLCRRSDVTDQTQRNKAIGLDVLTKSFNERDVTALKPWVHEAVKSFNATLALVQRVMLTAASSRAEGSALGSPSGKVWRPCWLRHFPGGVPTTALKVRLNAG